MEPDRLYCVVAAWNVKRIRSIAGYTECASGDVAFTTSPPSRIVTPRTSAAAHANNGYLRAGARIIAATVHDTRCGLAPQRR